MTIHEHEELKDLEMEHVGITDEEILDYEDDLYSDDVDPIAFEEHDFDREIS